jgi:hypothetical protein
MTPTEKWIFCLALVYSVPSFFSGIGITLLVVRWRAICDAVAMTPPFLSPEMTLEERDFVSTRLAPADEVHR